MFWTDIRAPKSRPSRPFDRTVFWCNRRRWTRRTREPGVRRRPKNETKLVGKLGGKRVVHEWRYLTCLARTMYEAGRLAWPWRDDGDGGGGRSVTYGSRPWWYVLCSYWIQLSSNTLTANRTTHRASMTQTANDTENPNRTLILPGSGRAATKKRGKCPTNHGDTIAPRRRRRRYQSEKVDRAHLPFTRRSGLRGVVFSSQRQYCHPAERHSTLFHRRVLAIVFFSALNRQTPSKRYFWFGNRLHNCNFNKNSNTSFY